MVKRYLVTDDVTNDDGKLVEWYNVEAVTYADYVTIEEEYHAVCTEADADIRERDEQIAALEARCRELETVLRRVIKEDNQSHREKWGTISHDARRVIEDILEMPANERLTKPPQSETLSDREGK